MKKILLIACPLLIFLPTIETVLANGPTVEKPNILIIFIDDMGFADPGCFGNPLIKTPHIDQLARQGIRLTNFYVNSPICSASRVAITTGQYQGRWKIHSFLNTRAGNENRGMANYLDAKAPTTAKKLKQAGYATAHFGKWHIGGGRDVDDAPLPSAYGFDESLVSFEGLGDRLCSNPKSLEKAKALGHGNVILCKQWERMQIQTDRTIDFIHRHRHEPFFVRLFPNDVHDAHVPLPGTADEFQQLSDDPFVRNFLAVLKEMDRQIGRVMKTLDELNLDKKTLVIFTSDNGPTDWPRKYLTGPPAGFAGPYRGRKWSLYEGGIRMPFIARWTGTIPAGIKDTTSVVSAIDLSPTICRLVGVPSENNLDGLDRSDVLLGQPSERLTPVFWQYGHPHAILKGGKPEHQSPTFAVRQGKWKFLVNPDGSEAQLFDLQSDESETKNCLLKNPDQAEKMGSQIGNWARELGFDFDADAKLTPPKPTIAIPASGQLLRFVNHGVGGQRDSLQFDGNSWLDLPAFRSPRVAGGRSLQIKGKIRPLSKSGVILAHGDRQAGYSIYLDQGHLCFATCAKTKRTIVRTPDQIQGLVPFQATWSPKGEIFLKINGKLVARSTADVIQRQPDDSMQIGADLHQPVGDYTTPNPFSGIIEDLSFRYPNGN